MSASRLHLYIFMPLFLLMSFSPPGAQGQEVVRIPLDLQEVVSEDGNLYVALPAIIDFDAGLVFSEILDVRLKLTGSSCCHLVVGGQFGGPVTGGECYDPGLNFGFLVDAQEVFPSEHPIAGIYDNSPSFPTCVEQELNTELAFQTEAGPPDWSFLAGGAGTIYLTGFENPNSCTYPIYCYNQHSLVVTSAEIVVEIPVITPIESNSWGTLKAIYR